MLCFQSCSPEGHIGKGLSDLQDQYFTIHHLDSSDHQSTNVHSARPNLVDVHRQCDEHEKKYQN